MTGVSSRIKAVPFEAVRPLVYSLPAPIIGESLIGYATRCFERTALRQTSQSLAFAGIARNHPSAIASTLIGREVEGLAILLHRTPAEIRTMMHSPGTFDHSGTATIDFFGVRIRADYREKRIRRVAPRALAKSRHHRAIWDLRVFSFDPETREALLDHCPVCANPLGWTRAFGVHMCDHCVDGRGAPNVFLEDHPQPLVEINDPEALDFVTGLVSPDPQKRAAAHNLAPAPWTEFPEEILFETAIAFACALTMDPARRRTTLERPKNIEEYRRFTPEVLAKAGRAIIGGAAGFAVVADRIRAQAGQRPGYYGVKKELGPLFHMTVDQHLPKAVKEILRAAVNADMERTRNRIVLRRADYAGDQRYLPIKALGEETGLPLRNLGWLAESGMADVIRAEAAGLSPVLMPLASVAPLVPLFEDALHEKFAAGALSVKPPALDGLARRGLVTELSGPILGMFKPRARYFSKASVLQLAARIAACAQGGGEDSESAVRISKAVKRLGMTTVPWPAVIAVLVNGGARAFAYPGENKNWRTGIGVEVRPFVRAVIAELDEADAGPVDEWIGNQVVAEIIGVTEVVVWKLAKAGKIKRTGVDSMKPFNRSKIEEFARKYIFVPEIQQRFGISRACDVNPWLNERGVRWNFRLEENRNLVYLRDEVEAVSRREAAPALMAAE